MNYIKSNKLNFKEWHRKKINLDRVSDPLHDYVKDLYR